jgi:hypothetical protein
MWTIAFIVCICFLLALVFALGYHVGIKSADKWWRETVMPNCQVITDDLVIMQEPTKQSIITQTGIQHERNKQYEN